MVKKRYIITLAVILLLVVIGLTLSQSATDSLRGQAQRISGVALLGFDQIRGLFGKVDEEFQNLNAVKTKLAEAEAENARLRMREKLYRDLNAENKRLRAMLSFRDVSPYELLAARVIGRNPSNWWNSVVIDRGWNDNPQMANDLPVVSPRGVIGKTGAVNYNTSDVILVVDEQCEIAARIKDTGAKGLVVGEGILEDGRPRARMKYISKETDVAVGQLVETSGLAGPDGVFPPGLIIGRIVEVPPLSADIDFGLHREAIIEPNVDLSDLKELFILISTKKEPPQKK